MTRDEQLIAFCREAVRIPSPSGQERDVAELMKRKMEEYGFDEVRMDRCGSVLGRIRGKRPGKTILLDGHIDTVEVIDADAWTHDPFGGEIEDGRIYGRGASDMKGSDTAMISAAAHFAQDSGRDFAGEICVSCTVHEECFEGVSAREITKAVKPDLVYHRRGHLLHGEDRPAGPGGSGGGDRGRQLPLLQPGERRQRRVPHAGGDRGDPEDRPP